MSENAKALGRAMRPAELEAIRHELGISQAKLAQAIGIDARTMRRYIAGEREILASIAIVLRALHAGAIALEDL